MRDGDLKQIFKEKHQIQPSHAAQLGAATASTLAVPLQCNHNHSITFPTEVSVPLRGGHKNYLIFCMPQMMRI